MESNGYGQFNTTLPNSVVSVLTTFTICCAIIICVAIISVASYNLNDRNLMSKNIEQAIDRGVDPLSVRCSYQTTADAICITYSMKK